MAAHGTTATELKSGCRLSVEAELRQLRLARRLADAVPQACRVTLLACHAVPEDLSREDWVAAACDELIPAAAAESLADAVDIYVEDIAFSLEDLERVAAAASAAGCRSGCTRISSGPSGAAEAAARLGARSADHLNHVSEAGVAALGASETAAVLLPASTFTLRAAPAPVATLGTPAPPSRLTDLNPGTSPIASMPETIAFACSLYGMTPSMRSRLRPRTRHGCSASTIGSARWSPASVPTSCCWTDRRSRTSRTGRATTPSSPP